MKLALIGALGIAVFVQINLAFAVPPDKFRIKVLSAGAVFEGQDGCLSTFASVFGADNLVKGDLPASTASIFGSIRNTCTDEELRIFDGVVDIGPGDFTVNSSGSLAVLKATIIAYDFVTNTDVPIVVDLTFTARPGLPSFRHVVDRFHSSEFSRVLKLNGKGRDANVAGSILDRGVDYTSTPLEGAFISQETTVEFNRF